MDMSNFHRKKRTGSPPDLSALLARASALQAVSPTARVTTQMGGLTGPTSAMPPEIEPFAATRHKMPRSSSSVASFNAVVADALITHGKGS
jgi:predicted component of type VI protein secretion system